MSEDVARGFWRAAFEGMQKHWRGLDADAPALANAGQVCVRARAGGDYECWAASVGEHPRDHFVRLDATGGWRNDTAAWSVEAMAGNGDEGTVLGGLAEDCARREADGFTMFLIDDGEIYTDGE